MVVQLCAAHLSGSLHLPINFPQWASGLVNYAFARPLDITRVSVLLMRSMGNLSNLPHWLFVSANGVEIWDV